MVKLRRFKYEFGDRCKNGCEKENINQLELLDPREISGISVLPSGARVIALNRLASLKEKTTIILEGNWLNGGIKIKSIQRWESFVIIETDGSLCSDAKTTVSKLLQSMRRLDIKDAFFPGESVLKISSDVSIFYFGHDIDDLKITGSFFTSVRIIPGYLLFYCQREKMIKKMRLADVMLNWSANSFGLRPLDGVVFLGRIKDNIMPITLRDRKVVNMDIFSGRILSEERVLEDIGIFIGEVEGFKASMVADRLTFIPASI